MENKLENALRTFVVDYELSLDDHTLEFDTIEENLYQRDGMGAECIELVMDMLRILAQKD